MRILLIGATGQLGGDLLRNNPGHEIVAPGRDQLDLARPQEAARLILEMRPDTVINCAAFHNVPRCEEEPAQAFLINCVAVRDLASACAEQGARLVTFSSDYVFGGERTIPWREDDRPSPLQVYGITRLAGEHAALATAPEQAVVIRTCGLYGRSGARSKGGNFVDGRVADARAGKRIEMACEQIIAPTSTDDLSRAVYALIAHPALAARDLPLGERRRLLLVRIHAGDRAADRRFGRSRARRSRRPDRAHAATPLFGSRKHEGARARRRLAAVARGIGALSASEISRDCLSVGPRGRPSRPQAEWPAAL